MRRRLRGDDTGAATTIVVVGMALALAAMTLMLSRLAHANDLRTKAQHGADAAALAAVAEIRDRAALAILAELLPYGTTYLPSTAGAAQRFAAANDANVTTVLPTGFYGHTVRAGVSTRECQTRTDKNEPLGRIPCRPGEKNGRHGTATAYAQVTFPVCIYTYTTGVICDGRKVRTMRAARDLFNVRLVDGDDPLEFVAAAFEPPPATGPAPDPGTLPATAQANRRLGERLAAGLGWTGDQWKCLDRLWQHESGWNHTAENASSGAYGIVQALPPDKLAAYGADYRTNPVPQIRWGLAYISGRYGSPCAAWAWWQRTDARPYPGHWY